MASDLQQSPSLPELSPWVPCSQQTIHDWTPMTTGHEHTCRNRLLSLCGQRSPGAPIHLLSKFDRVAGEPGPKQRVQVGSRGDLHHLLVPPLDGAVPLVQVQDVPVLVPCGKAHLLQA